mgnify:CR=1 FL=1
MNLARYLYYMYYRTKIFLPKKTYSMFGEDLKINEFFKRKKKGIYVDIGCYHPLDGSNTYLLYKRGWKGVNVDINKTSIDLFNIARKKDLNLNIAISDTSKKVKVFYRKKINMLNTIVKKNALSNFKKGFKSTYINSNSLNTLLENLNMNIKKIDFLNLDIEGNELKALKTFNFRKYKPTLICVEIHNQKATKNNEYYYKKNKLYKLLIKKGYKLFWKNQFSFLFKL